MNIKWLFIFVLCVSTIAHGQTAGSEMASEDAAPSMAGHRAAGITQLIVKLKDSGTVSASNWSAARLDGTVTDIQDVIARVQMKRLQKSEMRAFGAAALSAPGAAEDPGADVQVGRIMTQGQHVLRAVRPMSVAHAKGLAADFAADSAVEYAEPDLLLFPQNIPASSYFSQQWGFLNGPGGAFFNRAWSTTTGSSDETVAVLDSGVLPHVNLTPRLVRGYDFISDPLRANHTRGRNADATDPGDWLTLSEVSDPESPFYLCMLDGAGRPVARDSTWHGTHVAGTIGADTHQIDGVAGGTWRGSVLPVRVMGKCGGALSDIADGMRWAAGLRVSGAPDNPHPAKVINMSLGAPSNGICPRIFQDAIHDVTARGVTVVVAAGNDMRDARFATPGNCEGVVTVAAHDRNGQRASFSNYGPAVGVSAPGAGILSTVNTGKRGPVSDAYAFRDGTSMAAPHVSAVIVLMRSVNPALTPAQIDVLLRRSARRHAFGSGCNRGECGIGMLDADAAVQAAKNARL